MEEGRPELARGATRAALSTSACCSALSNLIGNATRHARPGSEVEVRIESVGDWVKLRVVNEGSTVAPDHLCPLVRSLLPRGHFPQRCGPQPRPGLAIVAIARMHGGRVAADSRGGITSIGLDLPAAAAAAGTNVRGSCRRCRAPCSSREAVQALRVRQGSALQRGGAGHDHPRPVQPLGSCEG